MLEKGFFDLWNERGEEADRVYAFSLEFFAAGRTVITRRYTEEGSFYRGEKKLRMLSLCGNSVRNMYK